MRPAFLFLLILVLGGCGHRDNPSGKGERKAAGNAFARSLSKDDYTSGTVAEGGLLTVTAISDTAFSFELGANNGGNTGEDDGMARFINDTTAVFTGDGYRLFFYYRSDSSIRLESEGEVTSVGLNVSYDGIYTKGAERGEESESNLGFMTPGALESLKAQSGDHFSGIVACFHAYGEGDAPDTMGYHAYSGFVPGLGTLFESIILQRAPDYYFAGLVEDDTAYLYTNDPVYLNDKSRLPPGVRSWKEGVQYKEVKFGY